MVNLGCQSECLRTQKWLYQCPVAAVTKYHRLHVLNNRNLLSQQIQDQGISRATVSLKLSLASSQPLVVPGGPWLAYTSFQSLPPHGALSVSAFPRPSSLCVSVFLEGHQSYWARAHLAPVRPHLN